MLTNYFKITLRTLQRRKSYAALNVGGLAVGLVACLGLFGLAAGALALTIALATVSMQALRATRTNPAQTLRDQ